MFQESYLSKALQACEGTVEELHVVEQKLASVHAEIRILLVKTFLGSGAVVSAIGNDCMGIDILIGIGASCISMQVYALLQDAICRFQKERVKRDQKHLFMRSQLGDTQAQLILMNEGLPGFGSSSALDNSIALSVGVFELQTHDVEFVE